MPTKPRGALSPLADKLPPHLRLSPVAEPKRRPVSGLRKLSADDLIAISDDASRLFAADDCSIEAWEITTDAAEVRATRLWRHDLPAAARQLVASRHDAVAGLANGCLIRASGGGVRTLAELSSAPTALTRTRRHIVAALPARQDRSARLVAIDGGSGRVVYEESIPHPDIALSPGSGDTFTVVDRRERSVRHVDLLRRCREPKRPPPRPATPGADTSPAPDPCCPKPPRPGTSSTPPRPPDSSVPLPGDCRPGDGGFQDDCIEVRVVGGTIVTVNVCDPNTPPCEVTLHFSVREVQRTSRFLVAQSSNRRDFAVVDPGSLRVLYQRSSGRRGVSLLAPRDSDNVFLVDASRGAVSLLELGPLAPLGPAFQIAAKDRVFRGHSNSAWDPKSEKIGTMTVLIVPLLEAGQTFNGDIGEWAEWLRSTGAPLDRVSLYYDEATYEHWAPAFSIFGVDETDLYAGPPVSLPKKARDYYYGPFIAGGMKSQFGGSGDTYHVRFTGEETLEIDATSSTRSARSFTLRYPAASMRVRLAGESTLTVDPSGPTRLISFSGFDRQGDVFFAEARASVLPDLVSIDINFETLGNGDAQSAISSMLDTMLRTAFEPGGTAEGKAIAFEPPVVRWIDDGGDLGLLDVSIHIAPGVGPEKPYINDIHAVELDELGFSSDTRIYASFELPDPMRIAALTEYLNRVLQNAQIDHPDFPDLKTPYFGTPAVSASGGGGSHGVSVELFMSADDGNGGVAKIQPMGATGDDPLGLNQAFPMIGGDVSYSSRDLIRDSNDFLDDAFTAMIDAMLAGGPGTETERVDMINGLTAGLTTIVFSYVDLPPHDRPGAWDTTAPDVAGLRGWAKSDDANDLKERDQDVNSFTSGGVAMILSTDKSPGEGAADSAAETLAHELGHKSGFPDLYYAQGYRKDVVFMDGLDLMAGSGGTWPHFTSYHKLSAGWLAPEDINFAEAPSAGDPIDREVLLVGLERWDPNLVDEVRLAFPAAADTVPVKAAIVAQLAGDGSQFVTIEARCQGVDFSQALDPPRIVVANALDFLDDSRYAKEIDEDLGEMSEDYLGRYRRPIHLLDQSLRAANESFNLASAPEFPVVGMSVTVVEVQIVGDVPVFHVNFHWEQGDWIDLGFTDTLPAWRTPDIGIDWLDDGAHDWDIGEPLEQGEKLMIPPDGADPEPYQVFVRLWNFGTAPARDVRVDLHMYDPGGGGDPDEKNLFDSQTLENVEPSGDDNPVELRFDWSVPPGQNPHVCFRAVVADSDPPVDPETGEATASADSYTSNDWGQQNVFEFEALGDSPPAPVNVMFRVYNDGVFPERVALVPRNLPAGAKVTVSPRNLVVRSKHTRYFRVKIELEEWLLHAHCGKDVEFLLEAWRDDEHSQVRWGATKYRIKPRLATKLELTGYWEADLIKLYGAITPDIGQGRIRLRVHFEGEQAFWAETMLEGAGTFELPLDGAMTGATHVTAYARFEGTSEWSSSISPVLEMDRHVVG